MGHVLAEVDFMDVAHGCIDSTMIGGSKDREALRLKRRRNPATGAGLHLK
jgi:hypothetical protein